MLVFVGFLALIVIVVGVMWLQQPSVKAVLNARRVKKNYKHLFTEAFKSELKKARLEPPESLFTAMVETATTIYELAIPKLTVKKAQYVGPTEENPEGSWIEPPAVLFDPPNVARATIRAYIIILKNIPLDVDGQFLTTIRNVLPHGIVSQIATPFFDAGIRPFTDAYMRAAIGATLKKRKSTEDLIYPEEFKGNAVEHYLDPTPLFSILDVPIPFRLSTKTRRDHHFILGPTGSGKTSYVSNLLERDLESVSKGTSLIIMDSQGPKGLAYNVARLPIFAKGGPLEGKLIYIHPDNPIAANPFLLPPSELSIWFLKYIFGGMLDIPLTELQAGPVEHIIRAMQVYPEPSLAFFQTFFRTNEKGKLSIPHEFRPYFDQLDPETQRYFKEDFRSMLEPSRAGIVQKLSTLAAKKVFSKMLNARKNKLNLSKELRDGKVVVIDANLKALGGPQAVEAYTRFFIALVLMATYDRFDEPEDSLNSIWFYMDEAHNFIANDPHMHHILDQARKQAIGVTASTLRANLIKQPDTREALEAAHIQARCLTAPQVDEYGTAEVSFKKGPPRPVLIRPVHLPALPKMPPAEWGYIWETMRITYGADDVRKAPADFAPSYDAP